jgi:hypothetical protein
MKLLISSVAPGYLMVLHGILPPGGGAEIVNGK